MKLKDHIRKPIMETQAAIIKTDFFLLVATLTPEKTFLATNDIATTNTERNTVVELKSGKPTIAGDTEISGNIVVHRHQYPTLCLTNIQIKLQIKTAIANGNDIYNSSKLLNKTKISIMLKKEIANKIYPIILD